MREHLHRLGEKIKDNKAETFVLGLGAAALAWEALAPDKSKDLISHAAWRHEAVTAVSTFILGMHLNQVWRRIGLENLDPISQFGKRIGMSGTGDVEG